MYAKIQITGTIEAVTGMHIGGSSAFSAIGAVDSPIIKDVKTNNPMIPGSSLKGKMRTLLAKNIILRSESQMMMMKGLQACLEVQKRKISSRAESFSLI